MSQTTTRNLLRVSTDLVLERNKLGAAEAPTTAATGLTLDGRLPAPADAALRTLMQSTLPNP
jgi:hypothetical protein